MFKIEKVEKLLDFKFSKKVKEIFSSYDIVLLDLTEEEYKENIESIENFLKREEVVFSGEHRIGDWNKGWDENAQEFEKTKQISSLIPKYFNKYKYVRFDDKMYKIGNNNVELNMLRVLQHYINEKYLKSYNFNNVYEFGCGTGHNLLALSEMSDCNRNYYGLDWTNTQEKIFKNIKENFNENFSFRQFDFLNPDNRVDIQSNSVIFTFAALEQIGENHTNFINFLLEKKPRLCIHLEPIEELLDKNNFLQKLSLDYFKKRKYLSKFYTNLKILEENQKINILEAKRTTFGSFFIEGYNIVVWEIKQ